MTKKTTFLIFNRTNAYFEVLLRTKVQNDDIKNKLKKKEKKKRPKLKQKS